MFHVYNQFTFQFVFIFHHPHRIILFTKCIIIKFNFVNLLSISDTHSHIVITVTVKHWLQVYISCVFIHSCVLSITFNYISLLWFSIPLLFISLFSMTSLYISFLFQLFTFSISLLYYQSVFQISIINFRIAIFSVQP